MMPTRGAMSFVSGLMSARSYTLPSVLAVTISPVSGMMFVSLPFRSNSGVKRS